jgi:DNA polymerase
MINSDLKVVGCFKCDISLTRRKIVSGRGPTTSKVMIIGEAPGADEDKSGIPFIGKSGIFLRAVLRALMIEPKNVYITNVIKCRTLYNKVPSDVEVNNCFPYLITEVVKVNPTVILLLGNTALQTFFPDYYSTITKERGKLKVMGNRIYLATYHPSYVLRNRADSSIVNEFWEDLQLLQKLMRIIYR